MNKAQNCLEQKTSAAATSSYYSWCADTRL